METISGDGLEGNFREQGLPLNISTYEAFTISAWDNLNSESMLVATGFAPLLVNLESMIAKPKACGGSKNCVAWEVEKAMHYFMHTDKATTDSSTE